MSDKEKFKARLKEKTKALFNGDHKGFIIYVCVALAVAFLIMFALPGNNVFNWMRSRVDIKRQKRQIEYYQKQIEEIDREMNALSTNKDSLERFAREQFQYASPGDDVYILE